MLTKCFAVLQKELQTYWIQKQIIRDCRGDHSENLLLLHLVKGGGPWAVGRTPFEKRVFLLQPCWILLKLSARRTLLIFILPNYEEEYFAGRFTTSIRRHSFLRCFCQLKFSMQTDWSVNLKVVITFFWT